MAKFEYDESGGTSLYFLVSFYVLFLIPFTYYLWPSKEKKEDPEKLKKQCHCDACEAKRERLKAPAAGAAFKNIARWVVLAIAWTIFVVIAVKASQVERDHIEYDPFEILQLDRGATDREIKRQYRILSLKYHPDKEGGDPDMFMKIAKAHAALTDEESRKNWEEHGNPDGPQATEFGIALPAWIVDQNNSVWVLAAYILAFIIILPIGVGTWWYRSIRYNAEEVLMDTTQLFLHYIYKTPAMNFKRVAMILSGAFEFKRSHNSQVVERPSDDEELSPLVKEFSNDICLKNKERPFCHPYSLKARILLYAHFDRYLLPPNTLDEDRLYMVQKCPVLVQEMINTANQITAWHKYQRGAAAPNKCPRLGTVENIMKITPMLVQATREKDSLLQLPHFTEDTVKICKSRKRNVKTVQQFARLRDSERRYILKLPEEQYQDVLNVCAAMPVMDSEIKFQVIADEDTTKITAGCLVTATVTLKRTPLEVNFDEENQQPNGTAKAKDAVLPEEEIKQSESPVASKKKQPDWAIGKKKKKPAPAQQQKNKKGKKKKGAVTPAAGDKKEKDEGKEKEEENKEEEVSKNSDSEPESDIEEDRKDDLSDGNSDADVESDDEQWEELQAGMPRKEKVLEGRSKESHEVHCPYFPAEKQEWWWVYIADRKNLKFITAPTMVYDLKDEKEIQLQFPAPAKGTYTFSLCIRSDSYLDCDHVKFFKLDVAEAKKVEEAHPQWEDSESEEKDEEDSAVSDSDSDGGLTDSDDDEE